MGTVVIVFGVALLVAVLLSGLAARTVLSTSLLFLLVGVVAGPGGLGLVQVVPSSPVEVRLADLALFTVLFTDGMRIGLPALRRVGAGPVRALALGLPLTLLGIALLAKVLAGLDWTPALLVGAVLSPTDPVFASAIVGREEVPARLRSLLNVESGLNDGLALPLVVLGISVASGATAHPAVVLGELAAGVGVGLAVPLAAAVLVRLPGVGATAELQPLGPLAVGVLIYGICAATAANSYLAAFVAGSTLATVAPRAHRAFERLGDQLAELTKFAALLVFGALLTPDLLGRLSVGAWAVAVLALLLVRPAALLVSLLGVPLSPRERGAAAWFGPKGFASVVYGLLVLQSPVPGAQGLFDLVAVCIALSIVAHSSTDVPVARLFHVGDGSGDVTDPPQ